MRRHVMSLLGAVLLVAFVSTLSRAQTPDSAPRMFEANAFAPVSPMGFFVLPCMVQC